MKTFTEWEATTDGYSNSEKNLMELAWNASAENSAEEIERVRNAAPEVDQEPVAFRILRKNFDGEWVDDHRCWCNGKPDPNLIEDIAKRSDRWRIEYSYAIHPDAQAEIAKRDERIESLTAAGAEYQRQCFEQAVEISRLKEVIAKIKAQGAVAWLHRDRPESDVVTTKFKHVWGEAVVGSLALYDIPLYRLPEGD